MRKLLEAYDLFQRAKVQDTLDYERFNGYLVTHHSTSIEGSTLTKVETDLLLEKGITPAGKPIEHSLMVDDHYKALTFVLERALQKERITEDFMKEIGARVMTRTGHPISTALGSFDVRKGDYRLLSAYSGTHYYPSYDKIRGRMAHLAKRLQEKIESVSLVEEIFELSFDAHFELVTIHPFGDGNGRTSRLLMNYIQADHGLPLTTVFMKDRKAYIQALMKSRATQNPEPIRQFMSDQAAEYFIQEVRSKKNAEKDRGASFVF